MFLSFDGIDLLLFILLSFLFITCIGKHPHSLGATVFDDNIGYVETVVATRRKSSIYTLTSCVGVVIWGVRQTHWKSEIQV